MSFGRRYIELSQMIIMIISYVHWKTIPIEMHSCSIKTGPIILGILCLGD